MEGKAGLVGFATGRAPGFHGKGGGVSRELAEKGLTLDCCALNDGDTAPRLSYRYVAVWKTENRNQIRAAADGTAKLGWYECFDQYNIGRDGAEGPESGQLLIDELVQL